MRSIPVPQASSVCKRVDSENGESFSSSRGGLADRPLRASNGNLLSTFLLVAAGTDGRRGERYSAQCRSVAIAEKGRRQTAVHPLSCKPWVEGMGTEALPWRSIDHHWQAEVPRATAFRPSSKPRRSTGDGTGIQWRSGDNAFMAEPELPALRQPRHGNMGSAFDSLTILG